jgi:hypothetical protein
MRLLKKGDRKFEIIYGGRSGMVHTYWRIVSAI